MAALSGLSACKIQFSSQVYSESQIYASSKFSGIGFQSFKSGFYAFTQTQGCVKCHDSQVSPRFASANLDIAYENASGNLLGSSEKLVDFNNPILSLFIEYAGNGHCNDTPCSDTSVRPRLKSLIESWAQAEVTASNGGGNISPLSVLQFKTATLQVPAKLPTIFATAPGVMRFPLAQLQPVLSGLENAFFEIDIQMIGNNIYKINKPRVVGNTRTFAFNSIYVLIKTSAHENILGLEDTSFANNWHLVQAQSTASPLVDLPLYYKANVGSDYLRIGFVDIR